MTNLFLFIHLIFSPYPVQVAGPDSIISCHASNMPFPQFCEYIYRESGVKIYYHESWVQGLMVTVNSDRISVRSAVETALRATRLEVSSWYNDLIILPGEKLLQELPDLITGRSQAGSQDMPEDLLTQSEERYLTGRKANVTQVIQIGKSMLTGKKSTATIRGRITEQQTGEPVIGATMFIEEIKSGTATDQNGFLSMVIKPGTYTAVFAYMGLEKKNTSSK